MAWGEEEAVEVEEYGEDMAVSESEAEDVVVGQMPTVTVPKHIKKRSLKSRTRLFPSPSTRKLSGADLSFDSTAHHPLSESEQPQDYYLTGLGLAGIS